MNNLEFESINYMRENEYSCLAGPYDLNDKTERIFFENAIKQLKSIEHKLTKSSGKVYIWRQNMVFERSEQGAFPHRS